MPDLCPHDRLPPHCMWCLAASLALEAAVLARLCERARTEDTRCPFVTRRAHLPRLLTQVQAMAEALEAAELMPEGGHLQATMDTAWNALVALALGIEDWIARQEDERHA